MDRKAMRQVRVTWQGTVLLVALLLFGMTAAIDMLSHGITRDAYGRPVITAPENSAVRQGFHIIIVSSLVVAGLVVAGRLYGVRGKGMGQEIAKKLCIGLGLAAVGMAATYISANFLKVRVLGDYWYALPSGLYLVGLKYVVNAMNPDLDDEAQPVESTDYMH
jgi:hypothetical protein